MNRSINLKISLISFLRFFALSIYSQNSQTPSTCYHYKTWIKHLDNSKIDFGYLMDISGNSVVLTKDLKTPITDMDNRRFPVSNIKSINFRKRGQVGKYASYGALSGFIGGVALGYALGDDPESCWVYCFSATEKAFYHGLLISGIGAAVGALIGTKSIKIRIKGDKEILKNKQQEILKYKMQF